LVLVKEKTRFWLAAYASDFARHDWEGLKNLARRSRGAGISKRQLYELTLQGYLFLGFPSAIEAFGALDGIFRRGKNRREQSTLLRVKKGRSICRSIYREKYPALMQNLSQKSPELADWIIEEGYGKVLSRPGAELHLRELFSVGLLAATGFPKQLFAHLRALVEMGESPKRLAGFVRRAAKDSSPAAKGRIEKALKHFLVHQNSVWEAPVSSL
jgi:4-carboxymuconolactone decarboxylase